MTRTACLNAVYELAKQDERVVFIGSDLSPNTMLDFKRDFPDRFFMEGVQEQNIIGTAAGLALEGFIPYVNTIATFLTRRCYEQIAVDLCMHNLPVRLLGNGGGLVYAPLGPTHCAIEDIAIMRSLPNMSVVVPSDNEEMRQFMPQTLDYPGPLYVRLGKDNDSSLERFGLPFGPFFASSTFRNEGAKILILATGKMTAFAVQIAKYTNCEVFHLPMLKPFPDIKDLFPKYKLFVTMEEGIINGGLGTAVLECLADCNIQIPVLRLGLPDAFPHHYGEQEDLLETYGLTPEKMALRIREFYDAL